MRVAYFILPALLLVASTMPSVSLTAQDDPFSEPKSQPEIAKPLNKKAKQKGPVIIVSKETTRIEGPLTKEGYVDYLEALNQHCSRGVTPQNNAAVLFWKAMGPAGIENEALRKPFFNKLGIEPLPEKGDYFVSLGEFYPRDDDDPNAVDFEKMQIIFSAAIKKPWKKMAYPRLADWLAAIDKPLDKFIEGTQRPKYYSPLVVEEGESATVVSVLMLGIIEYREIARTIVARAMMRLQEGKIDLAWEDLMACRRLGQKLGEGAMLLDSLVGLAIDGVAMKGQTILAHRGKLSAKQAAEFLADLQQLGLTPKMVDKFDVAERYMYLDFVSYIARQEPGGFEELSEVVGEGTGKLIYLIRKMFPDSIDWNETLRAGNRWYDRQVAAGRQPTRAQREAAINKYNEDLEEVIEKAHDPKRMALALVFAGRKTRDRKIGEMFLCAFLPTNTIILDFEDRGNTRRQLTQLVFALEGYRADRGEYPEKLDKLKPKYINEIPTDIFSDKPHNYARQDKGYLLYSVGIDGEDDDGRDEEPLGDNDDITIRTPVVK